jgi:hypothetical protein
MVDIRRMHCVLTLVATATAVATGAALATTATADDRCGSGTPCTQTLRVTVAAGGLEQAFGAHANGGRAQGDAASFVRFAHGRGRHGHGVMTGAMQHVVVTDTRGGALGWSLTASITPLSNGHETIAPDHLRVTPSCHAIAAGSAPGAVAGSAGQPADEAVTLCTKDTELGPSGSTGGSYDVGASMTLDLPRAPRGHYAAVVVLALA